MLGVHGFRALVDQTLKRHVVAERNFNMLSGYGAFSGDFLELFNFLLSLSISFLGSFFKLLLEFEDHGFLMLVVLDDDLVLFLEVAVLLFELFHSVRLVLDFSVASFKFSLLAFRFDVDLGLGDVRDRLVMSFGESLLELSHLLLESRFFKLGDA